MSFDLVGKTVTGAACFLAVVLAVATVHDVVWPPISRARYRWANWRSAHGTRATFRYRLGLVLVMPLLNVQYIDVRRRLKDRDFGVYHPVGGRARTSLGARAGDPAGATRPCATATGHHVGQIAARVQGPDNGGQGDMSATVPIVDIPFGVVPPHPAGGLIADVPLRPPVVYRRDDGKRCWTCRFFHGGLWMCRRYPPTPLHVDGRVDAFHPSVDSNGWCGEWAWGGEWGDR